MKRVLLDTNVLINFQRQRDYMLSEVLRPFLHYELCISPVTYCEFLGAEKLRRKADARKFLKNFVTLEFNAKCITALTQLCAGVEMKQGKAPDTLIAATALGHRLTLLTSNRKDFESVQGLQAHFYKQP